MNRNDFLPHAMANKSHTEALGEKASMMETFASACFYNKSEGRVGRPVIGYSLGTRGQPEVAVA